MEVSPQHVPVWNWCLRRKERRVWEALHSNFPNRWFLCWPLSQRIIFWNVPRDRLTQSIAFTGEEMKNYQKMLPISTWYHFCSFQLITAYTNTETLWYLLNHPRPTTGTNVLQQYPLIESLFSLFSRSGQTLLLFWYLLHGNLNTIEVLLLAGASDFIF